MPRIIAAVAVAILSLCAVSLQVTGQDKPASEKDKIEALIKQLENIKDAKFVRNDREYDAKTAAKFVRGKWDSESASIKTAKDFIEKAASVSSTTGKPYLIRFKSGKEVTSRDYLTAELMKIEKGNDK